MMEMKWPRKHLEKHQSRILFNEENESTPSKADAHLSPGILTSIRVQRSVC